MRFNDHTKLAGLHAPFSPSKSHWLRYSDEKIIEVVTEMKATERGTRLHEYAKMAIELKVKQPKSKKTLYSYINDAIGFKMQPEVVLFVSPRFFGTADAISFRKNPDTGRMILRIHDLKTGVTPARMEQLEVYAAFFCLEYKIKPGDIDFELRIYQSDDIICHTPTAENILPIMDRVTYLDRLFENLDNKEG